MAIATWPQGIASTNYSRWYAESQHGFFGFVRIHPDLGPYEYGVKFWEPFVLARRVEPQPPRRKTTRKRPTSPARCRSQMNNTRTARCGSSAAPEAEPYTLPRYSESYVGRFRNKVAFISSLRAQRYTFYTLLQEFASHHPHPVGNASSDDSKAMKKIMWRVDDMHKATLAAEHHASNPPGEGRYAKGWHCQYPPPPE